MLDFLLPLNFLLTMVGGCVAGGLSGAQLTVIVYEALNVKPKNIIIPLVLVWTLAGGLAGS